jgi:hypothetical protein
MVSPLLPEERMSAKPTGVVKFKPRMNTDGHGWMQIGFLPNEERLSPQANGVVRSALDHPTDRSRRSAGLRPPFLSASFVRGRRGKNLVGHVTNAHFMASAETSERCDHVS